MLHGEGDDAHLPRNRLGRDLMVACHHDHLHASSTALFDGFGHRGLRGIDEGNEPEEAQASAGYIALKETGS